VFQITAKVKTIRARDFFTLGTGKPITVLEPDIPPQQKKSWRVLTLDFDKKPPDAPQLDFKLTLKLLPMTMVFSKPLLDKISTYN